MVVVRTSLIWMTQRTMCSSGRARGAVDACSAVLSSAVRSPELSTGQQVWVRHLQLPSVSDAANHRTWEDIEVCEASVSQAVVWVHPRAHPKMERYLGNRGPQQVLKPLLSRLCTLWCLHCLQPTPHSESAAEIGCTASAFALCLHEAYSAVRVPKILSCDHVGQKTHSKETS